MLFILKYCVLSCVVFVTIGCLQFCITNKERAQCTSLAGRVTGCLSIVFNIVNSTHCLRRWSNSAVRTSSIVTNVCLVIRCVFIGFQLSRGLSSVYLLGSKRFYKITFCERAHRHVTHIFAWYAHKILFANQLAYITWVYLCVNAKMLCLNHLRYALHKSHTSSLASHLNCLSVWSLFQRYYNRVQRQRSF